MDLQVAKVSDIYEGDYATRKKAKGENGCMDDWRSFDEAFHW